MIGPLRTFEKIDPEDPSPLSAYLEVTDANDNTMHVETASVLLFAESGSACQLARVHI